MRGLLARALTAAAIVLAFGSARAAAAEPPPIRLSVPACATLPFSLEAFLGSLEVELAGQVPSCCVLDPAPSADASGLQVALHVEPCAPATRAVDVQVHAAGQADTARRVDLGDVPADARPRALALAVAELVHSVVRATAPVVPPAPVAPPAVVAVRAAPLAASPPATTVARPATPPLPRTPHLFFTGLVAVETHPGNNLTIFGVRPSVAVARGHWQVSLDVDALAGDPSVPFGDVSTKVLAGTLAVGPRLAFGRALVDAAACGTFGWGWMSGHASEAGASTSSGDAPITRVGGRLGVVFLTAARVSDVRALVEAGTTLHGLDATVNGRSATGLTGGYLIFGLGFGENR